MHDARDVEDTRLLAAGENGALVESYYETIIQRCRVRCRSEEDALDCAQSVAVRLLSELKRGRRYPVPSADRGLTAYDAFYAVLAEALEVPLVTADRRLAAAVPGALLVA
jgi:predicted nucleic acid-binding protein